MIFTTLIWFRSVYKISSCCWFCIRIWIKWELWKIFDTKNELSLVTMWYPNKDKVFLNEYIRKCILSAQLVLSSQHTYLCKTLISHSNPFKHEITQPNMKLMINDLNDKVFLNEFICNCILPAQLVLSSQRTLPLQDDHISF